MSCVLSSPWKKLRAEAQFVSWLLRLATEGSRAVMPSSSYRSEGSREQPVCRDEQKGLCWGKEAEELEPPRVLACGILSCCSLQAQ